MTSNRSKEICFILNSKNFDDYDVLKGAKLRFVALVYDQYNQPSYNIDFEHDLKANRLSECVTAVIELLKGVSCPLIFSTILSDEHQRVYLNFKTILSLPTKHNRSKKHTAKKAVKAKKNIINTSSADLCSSTTTSTVSSDTGAECLSNGNENLFIKNQAQISHTNEHINKVIDRKSTVSEDLPVYEKIMKSGKRDRTGIGFKGKPLKENINLSNPVQQFVKSTDDNDSNKEEKHLRKALEIQEQDLRGLQRQIDVYEEQLQNLIPERLLYSKISEKCLLKCEQYAKKHSGFENPQVRKNFYKYCENHTKEEIFAQFIMNLDFGDWIPEVISGYVEIIEYLDVRELTNMQFYNLLAKLINPVLYTEGRTLLALVDVPNSHKENDDYNGP